MQDNKYYYDEQIKNYFYEKHIQSFNKSKEDLKDTSLSTLLALLTKQGLTDIAKRLDIKGYSKLGKDPLIALVAENINNDLTSLLEDLSYKELVLLKDLSKEEYNKYTFNIEELTAIGGLSSLGLLYKISIKDRLYLVVPENIKEAVLKLSKGRKYISDLKERSKGLNYIDGLMTHYGMLLGGDLYQLIISPDKKEFKKEDLDFYINYIFRSYEAFTEVNSLVHPYLFSPEDIFEELRVRQTIPYDYDNSEYYIALGEDFKSSWGKEVAELKKVLLRNKLKKDNADLLITELIFYIKNDLGTQSIIDLLNERGLNFEDEKEAKELIDALANVYNNTAMWTLKGLTPKELSERRTTVVKKDKEPGRNDQCPCGSGKKYKKCCGK
ncbi:SEC-C metal-binding domain-containing protein [Clostridium sp. LP20]|uniref:SEC-C metal-binding domain-containing protein n=1 Tax=Clostridium sp. LP20 TaxID=3418665 RepID=UPI003EE6AF02